MRSRILPFVFLVACATAAVSCVSSRPMHLKSNALEYLYPAGKGEPEPARDVTLKLPARVGLVFAPSSTGWNDPFTEVQKQHLLTRIADAFRDREIIARLEPIPSTYLTAGGSFDELDRLATAFGIDLIAIVSYDQKQFTESTGASWTYLTVVGAFAIQGEKNETRTLMDTVVYDIPSRALLFRSAGDSSVQARSTPVTIDRALRLDSEQSFETATDDLIIHLDTALGAFQEQVKSGTVRGAGTPAVEVVQTSGGSGGAGALGLVDLLGTTLLVGALSAGRLLRRKGRRAD